MWVPVAVAFRDCVACPATVSGESMAPTFNPPDRTSNDIAIAEKLSVRFYKYSRGDVVLLR